ncbi:MAG: chromosomal replication initiator protein DnaA [Phycisphaerae bacterium]|nr:chromosomal replication initiator protein DnaA [Phycisphaerae bacterium]
MAPVDRTLWQKIIEQVVSTGGNLILPWFTRLEPISLEHGLLEIQVPSQRELEYCQRHAARLFTEAAQAATGRLVSAVFLTAAAAEEDLDATHPAEAARDTSAARGLLPDYTFESFVTGPCNRLAHAACVAVGDNPGKAYNPLFIHGSSGLGKTHLLHAVCHRLAAANPEISILLLSCETFVNHFIDAVERGQLHEFRYQYRHADVLVIDDVQFLSDHEQTQEEFFHTFNTLYQSQKQIILTSDRGPSEIQGLEERLISRFNWGLVARMDRPCYETRVAIIRRKARLRNIELPEDVVCFIAGSIDSNIRELEGAITKVAILAQVNERPINLALAEEALGISDVDPTRREVTMDGIIKAVMARYNVRQSDLQSKRRSRSVAFPRQICMFLARTLTRHSLEEIGGYLGGRDHTTVLHACRTIDAQAKERKELQVTLDLLSQEIRASVSAADKSAVR